MMLRLLLFFTLGMNLLAEHISKAESNERKGPCEGNYRNFKCTSKGYYETVQCNTNSCFCVTAHTGIAAFDTTTNNNKTKPKCAKCQLDLQKLFAKGDIAETTFIPKCNNALGDFELAQCDLTKQECFCVDQKSGKEIKGSRKPRDVLSKITCAFGKDKFEFPVEDAVFPKFDKNAEPYLGAFHISNDKCKLERNQGKKCAAKKPAIKYFFDIKSSQCLVFKHLGCGGNDNVFNDSNECYSSCLYVDTFWCNAVTPPAQESHGGAVYCNRQEPSRPPGTKLPPKPPAMTTDSDGCPKGTLCKKSIFTGYCCDKEIEDRYNKAFSPVCKNGKKLYKKNDSNWFGKHCEDDFCPTKHTCETNGIFAFCCPV